jgi:hypothetical protein
MATHGISRVAPIGKRFGRVIVIGPRTPRTAKSASVLCRCDCGDERHYFISNLRMQMEPMCPPCRERSRPSKGRSRKHPLFNIWKAMIQRCENPNHDAYALYGGRGIRLCARWRNDFEAFAADMGERPTMRHTVDRLDTNGDYEPSNCRWATKKEQSSNRRDNRVLVWGGKRLTATEAAEMAGISKELLN